ncbi:MAG: TatD family hydrolase [Chloroflexota bacterium]
MYYIMAMRQLIDTHAHLDEITDLETVIAQARAAGIGAIVAVGSDLPSNQKVLSIAQKYEDFVYPALGLHPWNLKDADIEQTLAFIEAHIEEIAGIGEVGLDYHKRVRAVADKEYQQQVLRPVLQLASKYQKPVLLHSRYAWQDTFNLVREAQLEKVVFHWYTGTSSVLREIIKHGYFISATPAVEYHEEHRRAVKEVPLSQLLLETDSPVVYRRGTPFEFESRPADVLRSLKGVAELRDIDESRIAEITTQNARNLFGLRD